MEKGVRDEGRDGERERKREQRESRRPSEALFSDSLRLKKGRERSAGVRSDTETILMMSGE